MSDEPHPSNWIPTGGWLPIPPLCPKCGKLQSTRPLFKAWQARGCSADCQCAECFQVCWEGLLCEGMRSEAEVEYLAWCERHKWLLLYPPTNPGRTVAYKVQGAYLKGVVDSGKYAEFPLDAVRLLTRAWTMATIGCWDAYEHYMGQVQKLLDERNEVP
jgi:hypothetical protein